MFNRRALQVQMVKTKKNENSTEATEECSHLDPEKITNLSKDFVTHTAKAIGAVIATAVVLTTISQIAVKKTRSKDNQ